MKRKQIILENQKNKSPVRAIRFHEKEWSKVLKLAGKYCNGNTSEWIRKKATEDGLRK